MWVKGRKKREEGRGEEGRGEEKRAGEGKVKGKGKEVGMEGEGTPF